MTPDTILIVDDEQAVLSSLYRTLHSEPWEVFTELSGEQALVRMRTQPFKVVISDERMIGMQGAELLTTIKVLHPQTVRILLTGNASLDSMINVINYGEVFRCLTKPWDNDNLKLIIRAALHKHDQEQKVIDLFKMFGDHPELLPHIEQTYPGISRIINSKSSNLSLPTLNNEELLKVMKLMGPLEQTA